MGRYKLGQRVMIVFPAVENIGLQGVIAGPASIMRRVTVRGFTADRIVYLCDWADGDRCKASEICIAPIEDKPEPIDVPSEEDLREPA